MKPGLQSLCDHRCSRRNFIQAGTCALALLSLPAWPAPARAQAMQYGFINPQPAAFYRRLDKGLVQCGLCPRNCEVLPGDRGECGVRENREGTY
jgi:pyruvate formate lyase activating enzyme